MLLKGKFSVLASIVQKEVCNKVKNSKSNTLSSSTQEHEESFSHDSQDSEVQKKGCFDLLSKQFGHCIHEWPHISYGWKPLTVKHLMFRYALRSLRSFLGYKDKTLCQLEISSGLCDSFQFCCMFFA